MPAKLKEGTHAECLTICPRRILTCPKLRNLVKRFGNVVWEIEGGGRIWREIRLRREQSLHSAPLRLLGPVSQPEYKCAYWSQDEKELGVLEG